MTQHCKCSLLSAPRPGKATQPRQLPERSIIATHLPPQTLADLFQIVLVLILNGFPKSDHHDLVLAHEESAVLAKVHANLFQQFAPQIREREDVDAGVLVYAFPNVCDDTLL